MSRWADADLMLLYRLRRRSSFNPASDQRLMLTEAQYYRKSYDIS